MGRKTGVDGTNKGVEREVGSCEGEQKPLAHSSSTRILVNGLTETKVASQYRVEREWEVDLMTQQLTEVSPFRVEESPRLSGYSIQFH